MSGIGYYVLENYPLLGWGIFLVLWIVLAGLVSLLLWRYSQSKDSLKVEKDIRRLEKRRDDLVSEVDNMKEKTKNSLKLDAQIELEEERLRQIIEEKEEVEQWRTDNPIQQKHPSADLQPSSVLFLSSQIRFWQVWRIGRNI